MLDTFLGIKRVQSRDNQHLCWCPLGEFTKMFSTHALLVMVVVVVDVVVVDVDGLSTLGSGSIVRQGYERSRESDLVRHSLLIIYSGYHVHGCIFSISRCDI